MKPGARAYADRNYRFEEVPHDLFDATYVLTHNEDEASAGKLAQALRGRAFTVEAYRVEDSGLWGPKLDTSRHFMIAMGTGATDWREVADSLVDDSISSWLVQLPGDPRPAVPSALSEVELLLNCYERTPNWVEEKRFPSPEPTSAYSRCSLVLL